MPDRSQRLAIVTGAASGLGRAFCRNLIAAPGNWHIVALDIDEPGAQQTLAEVRRSGRIEGEYEYIDVSEEGRWIDLRGRLQRDWPRLDLLVNNAGVCMSAEIGDGALADWRRLHDVNYLGVLNGCHTMTPWLKQSASAGRALNPVTMSQNSVTPSQIPVTPRSPEGSAWPSSPSVINVASIMGLLPAPALGAYSASKAAVIALSEAMYAELRPHGVNVTVAAPGFFSTSLLDNGAFSARQHREQADDLVRTSKIDADMVASEALRASARGQLYAVMGRRARWFWRLKRIAPTTLLNSLSRRYGQMMSREAGGDSASD